MPIKNIKNKKIFIDTCSLLHDDFKLFWNSISPVLKNNNIEIIVPYGVVSELEKIIKTKKQKIFHQAIKIYKLLSLNQEKGLIRIQGNENEQFADNVFLSVFTKFRVDFELVLITQDNKLSRDILNLNKSQSVNGKDIDVFRITEGGTLRLYNDKSKKYSSKHQNKTYPDAFRLMKQVTTMEDEKLSISYLPQEGDYVTGSDGHKIKLLEKVAEGGEGIIYRTDTRHVAKIYKPENNTLRKKEKILLMLQKPIIHDGICYPITALKNSSNEFVGYLMPYASGIILQKIFIKKNLQKYFPNWKKRDTVELCITILEKISYLHKYNIILGDINPNNILIKSSKEVYFVDVDSYQIEDFPCPVGTINFTAPEIQRKHFSNFLRSIGNENFAVATLLFMIMLPGKPPYSQQGGNDQITNIINMDFSYPLGKESNKKTPDGPWKFIWSHLTYALKQEFYQNFKKGEKNSTEQTRTSVDRWLSLFKEYLSLLDDGKLEQQDSMSIELFPTRHKKHPGLTYSTCKLCRVEKQDNLMIKEYCKSCLSLKEEYPCDQCGDTIYYSNHHKYITKKNKYSLCNNCYNNNNATHSTRTCNSCGTTFTITNAEKQFFENKGFDLPKRCKNCRGSNNQTNKSNNSSLTSNFFGNIFKNWPF
ncbi:hypothetical protein B9T19_07635 [Ignatzschineria sp. F8392]|uniref:protein kinase domain-containing protein n=1 Tax=Ignatzschineria sp. F8392 TaxID=1980117 RepID=UPI000B99BCE6|nr:zinc-ribbon domain containing protein [Ignatzschineria sp. F8392]OYQ78710.1 hypothetical protein B9T19_07635 [Ignatzschineria sp. F8392]